MTEIAITKVRRHILEACAGPHGSLESKWQRDSLDRKAAEFLVAQQLLRREVGDGSGRTMAYRLHITERGRAALRGDLLTKI